MVVHQTDGTFSGETEAFANHGRMNVLFNQVFASLEQFSREDNGGRCAVETVLFLGFGNFDDHLRSRVFNVHFLENGCSVIRDDDIAHGIDEHFVHALGTERRANSIGHRLGCCDVIGLRRATSGSLCTVFQNEDGCLSVSIHLLALRHSWRGCLRLEPYASATWEF